MTEAKKPTEKSLREKLVGFKHHRVRHEGFPFEVDSWYHLCSDITFPTLFLPITRATATSICRYFAFRFFNGCDFPRDSGLFFSNEDVAALNALERSIDTLLTENADVFSHGAFLRLCGRSLKDADPSPSVVSEVKEAFNEEVHNLSKLYGYSEDDPQTQFMATGRVSWMRITRASEAMSLILSSERMYFDLTDWLVVGVPEVLCFRAWCPGLRVDREFRLYVGKGKLTGISQYDHYGFYPHLLTARKALFNNIVGFWKEQVQPRLKAVPNYSVDLCILCEPKDLSEEYKKENVMLLEMSPLLPTTGDCLFSWEKEAALLVGDAPEDEGGECLPVMRLKEKPLEHVEDLLSVCWTERFASVEDYKKTYDLALSEKGWFGRQWDWAVKLFHNNQSLVFVCDGLQRGHIWYRRYLEKFSKFCGRASVDGFHISVDPISGAPELVKDKPGKSVKGEVFSLENEAIADLDMFYNLEKHRHTKETITATGIETKKSYQVLVYVLVNEPKDATEIEEFTLDMEKKNYNPILHMAALSEEYLQQTILSYKYK